MPNASRSPRTRWTSLSAADPAQRGAAVGEQHQAGVAGQLAGRREVEAAVVVQRVELRGLDLQLGHAGVAGVGVAHGLAAVLLRVEADRGRLDPQRQVLADQRDPVALLGEVPRDREDPGVVVAEPEAGRERVGVGVVELDADGAALVTDRDRLVEPAVGDPQLVEHAQGGAGEVAQLRVVPLPLELGDDHDGQHHLVLIEASERPRIGEQHAGVEDVRAGLPRRVCLGGRLAGRGLEWARSPLADRRVHSSPGPELSCRRTGREPEGRSARPPLETGWPLISELPPVSCGSCSRKIRASRYGKLPHSPMPANVRRRGRRSGATRPTTR